MNDLKQLLATHFHTGNWTITRPEDGQQKECYIAQSDAINVFIKRDVAHRTLAPLRRLSEIGVAPPVLASGIFHDKTYVIQQYIAGSYPGWQWFAHHLPLLATFVKRYHHDYELTALLAANAITDYHEHIASDLAHLDEQFHHLNAHELREPAIIAAFNMLKAKAQQLQPVELVPVHADPNTKNILLTHDSLYMVDWDDITLSDSMRDAGQLLWWYVSPSQWPEFFAAYGLSMNEDLMKRIYWWAARTSFAIALWHVEHSYDCAPFLRDFLAALEGESNPHAIF